MLPMNDQEYVALLMSVHQLDISFPSPTLIE